MNITRIIPIVIDGTQLFLEDKPFTNEDYQKLQQDAEFLKKERLKHTFKVSNKEKCPFDDLFNKGVANGVIRRGKVKSYCINTNLILNVYKWD